MTTAESVPQTEDVQAPDPALRKQVMGNPSVRALIFSRLATALGIATLSYGAMVFLATVGATQLTISLVGSTRYLAALIFGISGGLMADAMSKRGAMVSAYALQAAACFVIPTFWGTGIASLVLLVFVVASLGQIAIPALKAATALVSSSAQVAIVAAVISVAGGIGAAMGSAILAPLLINIADMRTLLYVSGVILAFGAVRALKVPQEEDAASLRQAIRGVEWRATVPTLERTAAWLMENRKVAAMILVGSMVLALFDGMNTLMPVYMRDVLGTNPTNTVYVLAPGGIGFLAGSALGPWLMDRRGERALGVMALMALSLGFILFGLIDVVWPILAPFSPLRLLTLFGAEISPQIQAAGLISILTALGSTSALAAVQTYINRYVILARQASTFGMQEVLDNALTLTSVLGLGALVTLLGSRLVFLVAPPLIVAVVILLVRTSFRVTDQDPPAARAILRVLLDPKPDGQASVAAPSAPDGV